MDKIKNLISNIVTLNIIEYNILLISLENLYNIPSNINFNTFSDQDSTVKKKENLEKSTLETEFEIKIDSIKPDKKIPVLKIVKNLLNLGLRETKEALDNLPFSLKKTTNKEEAFDLKRNLEEAGAIVVINEKN